MTEVSEVEQRVREIVAKHTRIDLDEYDRDTPLETLNIESLDLIEIIFEVEDAFDVNIEQDEKVANLNTLGEILTWLTGNIEAGKGA